MHKVIKAIKEGWEEWMFAELENMTAQLLGNLPARLIGRLIRLIEEII